MTFRVLYLKKKKIMLFTSWENKQNLNKNISITFLFKIMELYDGSSLNQL